MQMPSAGYLPLHGQYPQWIRPWRILIGASIPARPDTHRDSRAHVKISGIGYFHMCVFTIWLEPILSEIPKNWQEAALRAAQTIPCARAGKKKGGWGE